MDSNHFLLLLIPYFKRKKHILLRNVFRLVNLVLMVGHTLNDLTEETYTHRDKKILIEAINQIK